MFALVSMTCTSNSARDEMFSIGCGRKTPNGENQRKGLKTRFERDLNQGHRGEWQGKKPKRNQKYKNEDHREGQSKRREDVLGFSQEPFQSFLHKHNIGTLTEDVIRQPF